METAVYPGEEARIHNVDAGLSTTDRAKQRGAGDPTPIGDVKLAKLGDADGGGA